MLDTAPVISAKRPIFRLKIRDDMAVGVVLLFAAATSFGAHASIKAASPTTQRVAFSSLPRSQRVGTSPQLLLTLDPPGNNGMRYRPAKSAAPLSRFRRVLQLRQRRQERFQLQQLSASAAATMLGPDLADVARADAEADLLQRLLPVLLVLLLTIGNAAQIGHVLQQVTYLDMSNRELGGQLGFDLVSDVFEGGELNGGLSNVVGQAVAEALGAPLLSASAELFLNAALAKAFGRRLIPLLIVGEAAVEAACDVAGQPVGDLLGDWLQPLSEQCLAVIAASGH